MREQNPPPPMTNMLNGPTTSTLSSWGIKISHPLWTIRWLRDINSGQPSRLQQICLTICIRYMCTHICCSIPNFARFSWSGGTSLAPRAQHWAQRSRRRGGRDCGAGSAGGVEQWIRHLEVPQNWWCTMEIPMKKDDDNWGTPILGNLDLCICIYMCR